VVIQTSWVILRALPGFYVDETMWIRKEETRPIPEAPGYYQTFE